MHIGKMTANKTHTTAVVLIPPEEVWEPIQGLRRVYDRNFDRWMPHITLLYPFAEREDFSHVTPILETVAAQIKPFQCPPFTVRSLPSSSELHDFFASYTGRIGHRPPRESLKSLTRLRRYRHIPWWLSSTPIHWAVSASTGSARPTEVAV